MNKIEYIIQVKKENRGEVANTGSLVNDEGNGTGNAWRQVQQIAASELLKPVTFSRSAFFAFHFCTPM